MAFHLPKEPIRTKREFFLYLMREIAGFADQCTGAVWRLSYDKAKTFSQRYDLQAALGRLQATMLGDTCPRSKTSGRKTWTGWATA